MDQFLSRLQHSPMDEQAWDGFVEQIRPMLRGWCRRWGLQAADAEDVSQNVLLRLARALPRFVHDPSRSFEGWLRTVSRNVLKDFLADLPRDLPNGDVVRILMQIEMPAKEARFDGELFAEACAAVRLRVAARTWEAFALTALEGLDGASVGFRLGMGAMAVFKARSRVQEMLRQEILRGTAPG